MIRQPRTPVLGALGMLVLNLPIGILSFSLVVAGLTVGLGTALLWVGIAVGAGTVAAWRGLAELERRRVRVMLGVDIASPYRRLPARGRWPARLKDPATWRDMAYHLLLLPLGAVQFGLMTVLWSAGGWLLLLPVTVTWLPDDWRPEIWHLRIFDIDSWVEALPCAALGGLVLLASIPVTRWLGAAHARFASSLLGPAEQRVPRVEPLAPALVGG